MPVENLRSNVREYGEVRPDAREETPRFFAEVKSNRGAFEPFALPGPDYASTRGRRACGIGGGSGTDQVRSAPAGADVHRVGSIEHRVRLVREARFAVWPQRPVHIMLYAREDRPRRSRGSRPGWFLLARRIKP